MEVTELEIELIIDGVPSDYGDLDSPLPMILWDFPFPQYPTNPVPIVRHFD